MEKESYWQQENKKNKFNKKRLGSCDVLIIGGGMTGIMTAYLLSQKKDLQIILVESNELANSVSSKTSAKLTPIHNLLYQDIENIHGLKYAKEYFSSQEYAIENIVKIIEKEKIDCHLIKEDNYTYAQTDKGFDKFQKEYEVLKKMGIDIELTEKLPTKQKVKSAFVYHDNYLFHPIKYLNAIIEILKTKDNVTILEHHKAIDYQKNDSKYLISFDNDVIINASKVVVATHYPIFNCAGLYFGKLYQEKSYVIAFETKKSIDGMYINTDPVVRSLRYDIQNEKKIGIMVGNSHISGKDKDPSIEMEDLKKSILKFDPKAKILYTWANQDVMSIDFLPFIGTYSRWTKNMYVATGFQTWGMTNSHLASIMITNEIFEVENPYQKLYNPLRFSHINSFKESTFMLGRSINGLLLTRMFQKNNELESLPMGEGAIITHESQKYAAYHDKDCYLLLKPNCTHTHCFLMWNKTDKTWDCKCHGSRFNTHGKVIIGPAAKDLELIKVRK